MGVLLGGLSSLLYGVGDFLGGEGAKRASAASMVLWAGAVSVPLITAAAFLVGGSVTTRDLWLGAAAGTAGAFGLVSLFAGLARGQASAVAPASAAFNGVLPVVFAVVAGERPSTIAWLGVVLAIPAIMLTSWVADRGELPLGGLGYGVMAGLGFGAYTIVISATSEGSNLLPLIPARTATMGVVLLIAVTGMWRVSRPVAMPAGIVAANGILDVGGNVSLLLGLRAGSLALVATAASLYPAVTVLMARLVNREELRGRQVLGLGLILVALAAIALG